MTRVTLGGPELTGFTLDEPAASVRLLLPHRDRLLIPMWNGNEFLFPDGERPIIRTFTPRRFDPDALTLDVDIVLHESGAAARWAAAVEPGGPAAVSGPGRGYPVDPGAAAYLLAGDETAIPAICQLLEALPDVPITVIVEITDPEARLDLHREVDETWLVLPEGDAPGSTLLAAIRSAGFPPGGRLWAAGEAAAMHGIRKIAFDEWAVSRSLATVRGYWKRRDPA